jgi:hypothetical protein
MRCPSCGSANVERVDSESAGEGFQCPDCGVSFLLTTVDARELRPGPIRSKLSDEQLAAIRQIHHSAMSQALYGDKPPTLEETEIQFMRDMYPDVEIRVWLTMSATFDEYVERHPQADQREAAAQILSLSTGVESEVDEELVKLWAKSHRR